MLYSCSGDIFCTNPPVSLAHGCNCAGAMGKGIAVQFKARWPEMYARYKQQCAAGTFALGDVFVWDDSDTGRMIFNLAAR